MHNETEQSASGGLRRASRYLLVRRNLQRFMAGNALTAIARANIAARPPFGLPRRDRMSDVGRYPGIDLQDKILFLKQTSSSADLAHPVAIDTKPKGFVS
jgi:hypothetical protein